jgi:ABC-type Fe3+ transport system permease subunit
MFGPGALAGTLAIAVHSIGFTGKFLSEAIEEAKPGPIEALTAAGAPPLAILLKGYWPQVKPAFLSIAVFRWDINVRESAVLGLVGGGGLGMALDTALSNLYWDQAGLVLFVIFVVVIVTEVVTAWVRSRSIETRSRRGSRSRSRLGGMRHADQTKDACVRGRGRCAQHASRRCDTRSRADGANRGRFRHPARRLRLSRAHLRSSRLSLRE